MAGIRMGARLQSRITTAGRFPGGLSGICFGGVVPEPDPGDAPGLVRDDDGIRIDAARGEITLRPDPTQTDHRRSDRTKLPWRYRAGMLARCAARVGQARDAAATHSGGADWRKGRRLAETD